MSSGATPSLRRITKGFARRIYLSARSESIKRRTKVMTDTSSPSEAAMKLSFAVLLAVANKWRGVRMDVFAARKVEELRQRVIPQGTSEESALLNHSDRGIRTEI